VKKRKKAGTQTSSFGSKGRVNHDSSSFYASRLYQDLPREQPVDYLENKIPAEVLDAIVCTLERTNA
jgi:modification methylase